MARQAVLCRIPSVVRLAMLTVLRLLTRPTGNGQFAMRAYVRLWGVEQFVGLDGTVQHVMLLLVHTGLMQFAMLLYVRSSGVLQFALFDGVALLVTPVLVRLTGFVRFANRRAVPRAARRRRIAGHAARLFCVGQSAVFDAVLQLVKLLLVRLSGLDDSSC